MNGDNKYFFSIAPEAISILFNEKQIIDNKSAQRRVKLLWQNQTEESAVFMYSKQTREVGIIFSSTGNAVITPDCIGSLFVLAKKNEDSYVGFIVDTEIQIEDFLSSLWISPTQTNSLIKI